MASTEYTWEMLGLVGIALLFMLYSSHEGWSQQPASTLSAGDITFLDDAAQGGLDEVRLGHMALEISHNARIRNFGQKMIDDHTQITEDIRTLAARKNVALPKQISPKQEADNKRLAERTGNAFDTLYIEAMLKDHRQDLAAFQQEAKAAHDPELRGLAARSALVIEEHLRLADSIAQDLGIPIQPVIDNP